MPVQVYHSQTWAYPVNTGKWRTVDRVGLPASSGLPLFDRHNCVIINTELTSWRYKHLEAIDIARRAVEIGNQKQAENVVLLDSRQACNFTDYMVLLTGESSRQINAIRDEVIHSLKQAGVYARNVEGEAESGWVLIDYIDAVVHIFAPAEREYYQLDTVWPNATPVIHFQ